MGIALRKSSVCLVALSAAAAFGLASAAQAGTVFNTSLADPPGVFFGHGNFNTHYAVTTDDGIEIGLKSKIRGDASDSVDPVGDAYTIGLGHLVNYDFAVDTGSTSFTDFSAIISVLNVRTGQTNSFAVDPTHFTDDSVSGNTFENSEQLAFAGVGFSTAKNDTYDVTLTLSGPGVSAMSVENVIHVGSGAVPEPASWALMILGMGGIGFSLRRNRAAIAAA